MKAILHIGAEKTGSTTLQDFIQSNTETLAERDIVLLRSTGADSDRALATFAMSEELQDDHTRELGIEESEQRARWRHAVSRTLEAEMRTLPQETRCVLMSSEHLHSRLRSEADIVDLRELLDPWFSEFLIIAYLRRQDRLAVSWFSTYYKSGGTKHLAERHRQQANFDPHFYRYDELLGKWAAVFGAGSLRPRLFERSAFEGGNLLSDFLSVSGIGGRLEDFRTPERRNAALNTEALELLRQFNQQFPSRDNDATARHCFLLRLRLIEQLEASHSGSPQVATEAEARAFYAHFKEGNDRLARNWFQRNRLFSEDFSMYPQRLAGPDLEFGLVATVFSFLREELERLSEPAGAAGGKDAAAPAFSGGQPSPLTPGRLLARAISWWRRLRAR